MQGRRSHAPVAQLGEAEKAKGPVDLLPAERRAREGEAGSTRHGWLPECKAREAMRP